MNTDEYALDDYVMDRSPNITTKEDFITFLNVLEKDFINNRHEWENLTVAEYLNAIARCCKGAPRMKAGDPFVKDQKYIDNLKPFIDMNKECAAITYDGEGNEIQVKVDLTSWIMPETPWSIMAWIFFVGKGYE